MPTEQPHVYVSPSIMLDTTELLCYGTAAKLVPEDVMADIATWCQPGAERPGLVAWTFSVKLKLSYATEGSWNLIKAMRGTLKTVVLKPGSGAAAPGNPSATFSIYVPSIPFMDAEMGGVTEFDMEATVIGDPVFATT